MEDLTLKPQVGQINRKLALLGLILVSIAPTISVTTGFILKAGTVAIIVFIVTKLWIYCLPAYWHLRVEKKPISWSKPTNGGWGVSLLLGVGMIIVIVGSYLLLGDMMIDKETLFELLEPVGLTTPATLAGAIFFWVFINSVMEEYVFRWFITSKLEELVQGKWKPILLSAGIFTLHHSIALMMFISPLGTIIASVGVFIGGAIFSWIYLQYRSVWVAWVAHACADVAVFGIGWHLVIGF